MLEEDVNSRIYLYDLTDENKNVLEEVEFPENLKNKAKEGTIFKYINGTYEFHSRNGFDEEWFYESCNRTGQSCYWL